jgi:monothiol glutaredoxin
MNIQEHIHTQVTSHPVVLLMKGTPQFPQCGFSSTVVQLLKKNGVTRFFSINVLSDSDVRQGAKEYAQWPTFPQLYVNGEFVGGCDIVKEMDASGELAQLLSPYKTENAA